MKVVDEASDVCRSSEFVCGAFERFLCLTEFAQIDFQFGGVDFGTFMDSCVLYCDGGSDGERLSQAEVLCGKDVRSVGTKRKNAEDVASRHQRDTEPRFDSIKRLDVAPLRLSGYVS